MCLSKQVTILITLAAIVLADKAPEPPRAYAPAPSYGPILVAAEPVYPDVSQ